MSGAALVRDNRLKTDSLAGIERIRDQHDAIPVACSDDSMVTM